MSEIEKIKRKNLRRYMEICDKKFPFLCFCDELEEFNISEQECFPVVGRIVLGNPR